MIDDAIQLATFVIEEAIKLEPAVAQMFKDAFSGTVPTEDTWATLRSNLQTLTYAGAVPDTALTPAEIATAEAQATGNVIPDAPPTGPATVTPLPTPAPAPTATPSPTPAPAPAAPVVEHTNIGGTLTRPPGMV